MKTFKEFLNESKNIPFYKLQEMVIDLFSNGPNNMKKQFRRVDGNTIEFTPARPRNVDTATITFSVLHGNFVVADANSGKILLDSNKTKDPLYELAILIWGLS